MDFFQGRPNTCWSMNDERMHRRRIWRLSTPVSSRSGRSDGIRRTRGVLGRSCTRAARCARCNLSQSAAMWDQPTPQDTLVANTGIIGVGELSMNLFHDTTTSPPCPQQRFIPAAKVATCSLVSHPDNVNVSVRCGFPIKSVLSRAHFCLGQA